MNLYPETAFSKDANPDAEQSERRSVSHWLKLAGGCLAALLVMLLFWIGITGIHRPQPKSMPEVETRIHDQAEPGNALKTASTNPVVMPPANNLNDPATAGIQTRPIAAADQHTDALDQVITPLKSALADQMSQSKTWQNQQTDLMRTLQEQLSAQSTKLEQLAGLLKQNTVAKAKPVKRSKLKSANTRKSRVKLPVPFELVSIDQWGDQAYAVLRHTGQMYEKTTGQTLSDWRIDAINRDALTVLVKNPQGHSQTLSITSNAKRQDDR
jgi:hypothetical protein